MKTNRLSLAALALSGLGFSLGNAAVVMVTTDINADANWTSNNEYVLNGVIGVNAGATLNIAPGTIIRGQPGDFVTNVPGTLVIRSGAKIVANGTANNPIIFTTAAVGTGVAPDGWVETEKLPGDSTNGYWEIKANLYTPGATFWDANPKTAPKSPRFTGLCGGIVILGNAPTNADSSTGNTQSAVTPSGVTSHARQLVEGLTNIPGNLFGGSDYNDNSGSLTYVSIRHGGGSLSPNKEINGLSLAGVGSGTKVDYIEIWGNTDDAVEVWGGGVNLGHLCLVGMRDDGLDIDHGWNGYAQFVLAIAGSQTDKLSEQDGDDLGNDSLNFTSNREPKGAFKIYNATLIGNPLQATGGFSTTRTIVAGTAGISPALTSNLVVKNQPYSNSAGRGIENRRGNAGSMYNSIVTNLAPGGTVWLNSTTDNATLFNNVSVADGATSAFSSGNVTQGTFTLVKVAPTLVGIANETVTYVGPVFSSVPTFASGSVPGDTNSIPYGHPVSIDPRPVDYGAFSPIPSGVPFLQGADYRGAFDPAATSLWTDGWTAASKYGVAAVN